MLAGLESAWAKNASTHSGQYSLPGNRNYAFCSQLRTSRRKKPSKTVAECQRQLLHLIKFQIWKHQIPNKSQSTKNEIPSTKILEFGASILELYIRILDNPDHFDMLAAPTTRRNGGNREEQT